MGPNGGSVATGSAVAFGILLLLLCDVGCATRFRFRSKTDEMEAKLISLRSQKRWFFIVIYRRAVFCTFWLLDPCWFLMYVWAEAVDMNGRFQMQGGKNWFLPKEMNANRFFCDSHWLEIWSNHFYPSMGPNGGSVAMDSGERGGGNLK